MRKEIIGISIVLLVVAVSIGCIEKDIEARIPQAPDGLYLVNENWYEEGGVAQSLMNVFNSKRAVVLTYSALRDGRIVLHIYEFETEGDAKNYEKWSSRLPFEEGQFRRDGKYVAYALITPSSDEELRKQALEMVAYAT